VRAYASNRVGTGYGPTQSFKTLGQSPVTTIGSAADINVSTATLTGYVNANYLSTEVLFEYGTSLSYGNTITALQSPVSGNTNTNVSATLTDLIGGTNYHFRIKAINSLGTTYSNDNTFITLGLKPSISNISVYRITNTSAILKSYVNANYLVSSVLFEYGPTTGYGSTSYPDVQSVSGSSDVSISVDINSLTESTIYHFRVKAENSLGITYSDDHTFTTPPTLTDVDGNYYNSVIIGSQTWMTENLKTTKFPDGSSIPYINNNSAWNSLIADPSNKAFSWYNNDPNNKDVYGALYTWGAAMNGHLTSNINPSGVQGVCPTGWHLPSLSEWDQLSTYINGEGGKLKETGTSHWFSPNEGATNETGFNGLPAGQRFIDGASVSLGDLGFFWSATEFSPSWGWYRSLRSSNNFLDRTSYYKTLGQAVRCIKD